MDSRKVWWERARFGMFIHWGLYAIPGRGEWVFYQEHMSDDEYARLADQFQPSRFNPSEWVRVARDAGMRYMVLTTRHHDGFCLFDSAVSDFTAPKTACGRDLVGEFVEACRSADMPIGFYYSLEDWRFPGQLPHLPVKDDAIYAPMVAQAHAQVRELCSNYGKIDILWYDGNFPSHVWRSEELNAEVRRLQPDILINDRSGAQGDFGTPENVIVPQKRPWEACYTLNDSWGYARGDKHYKTLDDVLRLLAACVANGGNLLLNVGPDADGVMPAESVSLFQAIGAWLRANGDAIYGAGPSPVQAPALGWSTRKGDKVYLLVQRWPGSTIPFAWCGSHVTGARILTNGQQLDIEQRGDRVWLHGAPAEAPCPAMTTVELSFDETPRGADPPYS